VDIAILNKVDFSGNGYNLAQAINKNTNHKAVSMRIRNNLFDYPIHFEKNNENKKKLREIILNSDVIVIREFYELPELFGVSLSELRKKTIVMSFGGWRWRRPEWREKTFNILSGHQDATVVISSADFINDMPKIPFIPCCIPIDEYREKYGIKKSTPPIVMHSPSSISEGTFTKSTEAFLMSMERIFRHGYEGDCELVMEATNRECLEAKSKASVFFDRFEYLYGVNSIEAASLECAVLTYTGSDALQSLSEHAGMTCPFIIVDNQSRLEMNIELLLGNPHKLESLREACYQYARVLHDGKYSVKQLLKVIN